MMAGRATECVASSDEAMRWRTSSASTSSPRGRCSFAASRGPSSAISAGSRIFARRSRASAVRRPSRTGSARLNLADVTWMWVGAEAGLELHETTQAFCASRGLRGTFWWSKAESTWMLFDLGRWDELARDPRRGRRARARRPGGLQALEIGLPYHALVLARRGDTPGAAAVAEDVLPKARASTDLQLLVPALAAGALVAAANGDRDGALGLVRELIDVTDGSSDRSSRTVPSRAHEDVRGDRRARPRARAGSRSDRRARSRRELHGRPQLRRLPRRRGASPKRSRSTRRRQRRWRDFGGVPGLADALLGRGRCLVALGRPGAEAPLTEARELFAKTGDVSGLAESATLLA